MEIISKDAFSAEPGDTTNTGTLEFIVETVDGKSLHVTIQYGIADTDPEEVIDALRLVADEIDDDIDDNIFPTIEDFENNVH